MPFRYDATGIQPSGEFTLIPKDKYLLRIVDTVDGTSSKGNAMITVTFAICDGPYKDKQIRYHNVTFLRKDAAGAGIALAFLKAIGQPYKDAFIVDHMKWRGAQVWGEVDTKEYNGKTYNVVTSVTASQPVLEEVPF